MEVEGVVVEVEEGEEEEEAEGDLDPSLRNSSLSCTVMRLTNKVGREAGTFSLPLVPKRPLPSP